MLGRGEAVPGSGSRQPEAGIVHGDASKSVGKVGHHSPVEERPSGIAVKHEQHGALAFVEIVDLRSVDLLPMTLEWIEVFDEPVRSLHDAATYSLSAVASVGGVVV